MELNITIDGLAQLEQKLQQLSGAVARRLATRALRAGAKPIQSQARANAASMVGGTMGSLIARYIATRSLRMNRTGVSRVGILIDRKGNEQFVYLTKRKKPGTRHYIPAAIEYGHKTAKARRQVAPIHFMQAAAELKAESAAHEIAATLGRELEQEAKQ